jgi:hypothetical protein
MTGTAPACLATCGLPAISLVSLCTLFSGLQRRADLVTLFDIRTKLAFLFGPFPSPFSAGDTRGGRRTYYFNEEGPHA